jgi:hypothetical protein
MRKLPAARDAAVRHGSRHWASLSVGLAVAACSANISSPGIGNRGTGASGIGSGGSGGGSPSNTGGTFVATADAGIGSGGSAGGGIAAGSGSGAAGSAGAIGAACPATTLSDPGPAISRRLTRTEYNNTVRDLLGDVTAPAQDFPIEELNLNFDNDPAVLTVSPVLAQAYMDGAEKLAVSYVQNLKTALPCSTTGGATCALQFIQTFGQKALRRPLASDDVARYMATFNVGQATSFTSGIRLVVTAMLQSAPFLYRIEAGTVVAQPGSSLVKLTSWEMASRLSYFLWKTMPDATLFQAAQADQLQTAPQIAAQAQRMLADTRSQAAIVDFHDQWLNLRALADVDKDPGLFPSFTATVTTDLHAEAIQLISDVLFNGSGDVSALFTAPYTFMNANLANFYGAKGLTGATLQKVASEPAKHAGILSLGGLMSVLAKENQTSPPRRGKFVREQILCESIPPPPPGLVIKLPDLDPALTTRERFRQHATDIACSGCHQLMDPIGLSFESFDAVGRWRGTENGKAIDASGAVTALGTQTDPSIVGNYDGIPALGAKLAGSTEVKSCIVTNWFRYATARGETSADACALKSLNTAFGAAGYTVKSLLLAVARSDAFLYRRPLSDPIAPGIAQP